MYYIIDIKGTVHTEATTKEEAERVLDIILDEHPEYNALELEIINDSEEEE